jgi:metal-responsive CopG/Arc/MetJ family transcriptional regulator
LIIMKMISIKIEDELIEKVDLYATNKGISRSETIRYAIKKFLEQG